MHAKTGEFVFHFVAFFHNFVEERVLFEIFCCERNFLRTVTSDHSNSVYDTFQQRNSKILAFTKEIKKFQPLKSKKNRIDTLIRKNPSLHTSFRGEL